MLPRTIRARVTVAAVVLSGALLIVASMLMISVLSRQLNDNLDEGLLQRADTIESALDDLPRDQLVADEDLLIQVVADDGRVIASSANVAGVDAITALEPGFRSTSAVPGRSETFRVLVRPIDTSVGGTWLVVGVNRDDVTDPVRIVTRLLLVAGPAVVGLLGVLTWWLIGRVLRPVEKIRVQMAEISAANLRGRVPEPETGDEIDRLARTTNATLDRLEGAVRQQQRFVADASHELRTPLTRIRSELEVDLAHPERADPVATERSVLAETIELQQLVADLLHLARIDASGADDIGAITETVDLDDIVLREVRTLVEQARVAVDTSGVSAAQVVGDRSQLARAVRNVLDNAERHATSTVTISLGEFDGTARLAIVDDGAGIPAGEREHVFERFRRLDEARTRDAGGTGLGLAIAREIVERHAGTIRLADSLHTTFVIELPARA